jgi:hypothetical protein
MAAVLFLRNSQVITVKMVFCVKGRTVIEHRVYLTGKKPTVGQDNGTEKLETYRKQCYMTAEDASIIIGEMQARG